MSDTNSTSLTENFHAACFLLAGKARDHLQKDTEALYVIKANIRSWRDTQRRDSQSYVVADIILSSSWQGDLSKPQRMRRFGTAQNAPRFVAQLLRAAANMLDLSQDEELLATIGLIERSLL
jgi:hypothetical protein